MTYQLPLVIKKVMGIAMAKVYNGETETLGKHTANLLRCCGVIYKLFNSKHPINKELLKISIKLHDIGKCEKSWLDNKIVKKDNNDKQLAIRHEVLSFLIAYEYIKKENFSDYEKLLILMPILMHHNKYITVGDNISNIHFDKSSTMLKDNSRKIEWLHNLSTDATFKGIEDSVNRSKNSCIVSQIKKIISKLSADITKEQSYDIQYHCSILCAIDQMASAYYSLDQIETFFKVDFKMGVENVKLTPRDYQQYTIDSFDINTDILFIDFCPGAGKTLITENIANKLNKCIIHGTPKNIIADDLAGKFLGEKRLSSSVLELEGDDSIENMTINDIRRKNTWFTNMSPILYTTPDNIFLMSQGFKRHFMFLRALYNGILVFDEFHDCYSDDYRRFNLFEMIKKFLYFKIQMILMSGTTPMKFINKVMELCVYNKKNCHLISDGGNKVNHIYNLNTIQISPSILIPNKVRGSISFFNGATNSTIVTNFPWWNQEDFEAGYFFDVMNLIDTYVAKNESVAICFSSKKSILQFIHMFDNYSKYKFNKDYAVICSPNMSMDIYESTIKKALSELKKGADPKKRTFKFVLCTSYTEMGVDFSVQHMIIESTFIQNLDQQLGRLNRWGEYGNTSTCTIFPAFTRYTDKESTYRRLRYGSDSNYHNLNKFYMNKCTCTFDNSWYLQEELDIHYSWVIGAEQTIPWDFKDTCGIFRSKPSSNNNNGINGMYRKVDTLPISWKGVDFQVPFYRLDKVSGELNLIPHPYIFI